MLLISTITVCGKGTEFESEKLRKIASLLSDEVPYSEAVYNFTEKYLNQLISLSPKEREASMNYNDVSIDVGGLDRLSMVNDSTGLSIGDDGKRYSISFDNRDEIVIKLTFPMSYQLIVQKNIRQIGDEFVAELSKFKEKPQSDTLKPKEGELTKVAYDLYTKKGSCYYIEKINNDLYYTENKGDFTLVNDPIHLVESIRNILIFGGINSDIPMKLSVRQYGFMIKELQISLMQWILYCKQTGCKLYVGVEKIGINTLQASVFAVNRTYGYNHILNIVVPYNVIGEVKVDSAINATVTLYIPTHNISTLFDESELPNVKNKK